MMKWPLLLLSLFKPQPSAADEMKLIIKKTAVQIFSLLVAVNIFSFIFSAGIIVAFLDAGAQYDQAGFIYFSSVIGAGIGLICLALIMAVVAVKIFNAKNAEDIEAAGSPEVSHPLQDALALLITDIVHERELKRSSHYEERKASADESSHHAENVMQ